MASASERPLDTNKSIIRIHVMKAGLFSAAGHEHLVAAPIARGSLDEDEPSRVAFSFLAIRLKVEPDTSLSADDQAKVQRTMQEKVLECRRRAGTFTRLTFQEPFSFTSECVLFSPLVRCNLFTRPKLLL